MRIGAFELIEPLPELKEPHVFAMVRPWVDVGSVGTLTLNRLERFMGSKELGRLARPGTFFDFTRYRPNMRLVDGKREVKIPNSIIRYAITEDGPDYLFLHLMEPHSNGEDYTDSILEVVKHFNVKRYCRLGAMYDAVPHTRPLLVTGSLGNVVQNHPVPNFKIRQSTYQGPTTIMNLLSEGIEKDGIESINFMVHLPQYVQLEEDYAGTSRMIEVLSSVYSNIPADLAPVRRGQRQYRELNSTLDRNTELKTLIQQMEAYYDAQLDSEDAPSPSTKEQTPTTKLSPAIEEFLSELGGRLDSDPED
ncbi:MAG: PAC2 family protein [Chloroflexi bacterium]|nr:PAC2 family protein [Chloroflexota bacterium]MCI0789011.1 PAC2 family protein [Chloroflexota bacterium]MCI0899514.1 PAC2 family protein [Chloroflexota bacterium]